MRRPTPCDCPSRELPSASQSHLRLAPHLLAHMKQLSRDGMWTGCVQSLWFSEDPCQDWVPPAGTVCLHQWGLSQCRPSRRTRLSAWGLER